jgi:hypothetical protein
MAVCWCGEVRAFDYLEHSYFTDVACARAQRVLGARLMANPKDEVLAARYIALGLACPQRWDVPYCADGYKQVVGTINVLEAAPAQSLDYAITLGDMASLPDHLARWGPASGYARAGTDGVWARVVEWLSAPMGSAGGVIEDVGEDACETGDRVSFEALAWDVEQALGRMMVSGPEAVPVRLLAPSAREEVRRGSADPAGAYSFDNPHYLDLVLRNHNHFGQSAHASWHGFHSAGLEIAGARCARVMALEGGALEVLDGAIDWEAMGDEARRERACAVLGEHVARRAREWAVRGDGALVGPAREWVGRLGVDAALRERVVMALMGLVFEGGGLHFLQDGLAAGHMRTTRTRGGLQESRYDHDRDNKEGVAAVMRTRAGDYALVAFGDSYLVGRPYEEGRRCEWEALGEDGRAVSDCLVQQQRGWVAAVTMASLMDWALGGVFVGRSVGCEALEGAERWVCQLLPLEAPVAFGYPMPELDRRAPMLHAELPVPPPPFSYESLSMRLGMNLTGSAPQLHVSATFLAELDVLANWLTSYRAGIAATLGEGDRNQYLMEASYNFHWRWAARFMVDMGVFGWLGLRGFDRDVSLFTGMGPQVGLTLLPEGWVKTPLEISLLYRVPVVFASSNNGFFGEYVIDGHWLYIGFGLAFMK